MLSSFFRAKKVSSISIPPLVSSFVSKSKQIPDLVGQRKEKREEALSLKHIKRQFNKVTKKDNGDIVRIKALFVKGWNKITDGSITLDNILKEKWNFYSKEAKEQYMEEEKEKLQRKREEEEEELKRQSEEVDEQLQKMIEEEEEELKRQKEEVEEQLQKIEDEED